MLLVGRKTFVIWKPEENGNEESSKSDRAVPRTQPPAEVE